MNRKIPVILLLILSFTLAGFTETVDVRISNPRIDGAYYKFELEIRRTDAWDVGLDNGGLGDSDWYFNRNADAFGSNLPTYENLNSAFTSSPGNYNYTFTVQITGGKLQVKCEYHKIDWFYDPPLNSWVTLLTVSWLIDDTNVNAGVTWDQGNTGMQDGDADALTINNFYGDGDIPLPIQMAGLMARSADRQGVIVQWSTAAESQTLGFNVHRSDSKEGVYNLINPVMIPAKGEQSYGAEYEFIDRNVSENAVYWYKIEELAADGSRHWYGPISAEGVNAIPQAFDLSQNYPNPFNPSTTVQYQLPEADMVNIAVYSMLGQTVKVLLEEQMEAGYHEIQWDGTDSRNQLMPSGVYFLQVRAGTHVRTRKLILLR